LSKAERIADRHHRLTDLKRRRIAERNHWQPGGVDLQEGEICLGVAPHHLGGEFPPVVELHLDIGGVLDDVIVGDDVAVRVQDEARSAARTGRRGPSSKKRLKKSSKDRSSGRPLSCGDACASVLSVVLMFTTAGFASLLRRTQSGAWIWVL
jgi:hypothetical protein